jgi:hypothetical protein
MSGINGFQTTVGGSVDFTGTNVISEIVSIDLPELNVTDIDVSSMDSSGNFMEFIPGSTDPGTIDLTVNYTEVQDKEMSDILTSTNATSNDPQVWTITSPDSSTWAANGYVSNFGAGTAAPNEKITRTLSIKCTSKPTHTTNA